MEPSLTRDDLRRPGVRLLNRGGFGNADVLLVPRQGRDPVIVKDYSQRSAFARRWIAPFLVGHELAMLERVAGLPGLPQPRGRIDKLALAMEFIDGVPLRRRLHRWSLPSAFFDGLEGILEGLALRGVIYTDLRSPKNVLLTRATAAPALVDLASAYRVPLPKKLIRLWDLYSLRKLRRHFEESDLEPPEVTLEDYDEVDLDGRRVFLLDRGDLRDPVPAFFLHDVGHSADVFRMLINAAESHSRRAIGIDLPGFGRSTDSRRNLAVEHVADGIETLVEALRLQHIDLVGHGWGGLVARSLAARHPDRVRALVTLDTPLDWLDPGFRQRWEEGRRDPELLRRRLLRELPPGLSGEHRTRMGDAIHAARSRSITRAYAALRVRRETRNGNAEWMLRDAPLPDQPWLAIRSESVGQGESSPARLRRHPRTEWWPQPLADAKRFWDALEKLARDGARAR